LHLAVYNAHLDVVKAMCENIPNLDLAFVGRIPESSGLANPSEVSIDDENEFVSVGTHKESISRIVGETPRRFLKDVPTTKVRSLILFWALDSGNMEMLRYLWMFDDYMPTRWGAKNLEFMLMLANDLATSDMEDQYPIDELFSILLEPKPFSTALRTLPTISQAMEFIEDHVIKNTAIDHNLKLQLLYASEMASYSFLGALYHLSTNSNPLT
jgi:hypothetical protein